jgi:transposase
MSQDDHSLPCDVEQLQAMLLVERDQHREALGQHREALTHKDEALAHKEAVVTQQHDTISELHRKLQQQEHYIAQLLRRQYGPQRERIDPDQLLLFTKDELAELVADLQSDAEEPADDDTSDSKPKRKGKGHGRNPLPKDLPREQVVYELSAAELACPCCGSARQEIGSETSEQLEFIPAVLKVIEHVRKKYACRQCEEHVAVAAKAPQPIEKGLPGPGLLAHTVLGKYGDHLPLYRQEDILARHGVVIRRSTLCDWVAAAAELARPLWQLMREEVLKSHVIHTDDTTIRMLAAEKCQTARFWVYIGDAAHPYSVYDFTESRKRDGPQEFLAGFSGYLQADAYGGYDGVYASGAVKEVACMAHCRRYWWEARATDSHRAHEALSYIGRLYALEEQFREAGLAGDALRAARAEHAVPILNAFERWLDDPAQQRVLPKSPIGKARTYTRNQWQALRRYTEDGALSIDNNLSERTVKIAAIGRKNYLFVGSPTGGQRAAILYSLIATCKACGVEPQAYLADLFGRLPTATSPADLTALLPDQWLATHPEHHWHIDELRQKERQRSRQTRLAKRTK